MIKYLLLLLAGLCIGYWYGWTDHDTYSEPLQDRIVHSIGGGNRDKVKTDADAKLDSLEKHYVALAPKKDVTLSVLIPCYNEAATIDRTLDALVALGARLAADRITLQYVAVDDCSKDGTFERLTQRAAASKGAMVIARHDVNRGKGAAIQTARANATGDIVIIQDADLEYDPNDIPAVIAPILDGHADAVCGTRFGGGGAHRVLYFYHSLGNGALTWLSNMFTNLNLTDMEVGYKAFTHETFRIMHLTRERFGIEPEIVARLAQMGARVYEVPISYHGRTYAEGKKITWRDGLAAFWHIVVASWTSNSQPRLIR